MSDSIVRPAPLASASAPPGESGVPGDGRALRAVAAILAYNDGANLGRTLSRVPASRDFDVVVVDDGSTDPDTAAVLRENRFPVLHHERNIGIGGAIKTAVKYGKAQGYGILVILAGNGKDDPGQIPRLLRPLREQGYEYVQGSRNLEGGQSDHTPLFRQVMVKVHALMFRVLTGFPATDALNGFRAYRLDLFDDPRINIWQDWLDTYELETYLHYQVLRLRRRAVEVPVSKVYPKEKRGVKYSHIRPFVDWWRILRPVVYLTLGLRK